MIQNTNSHPTRPGRRSILRTLLTGSAVLQPWLQSMGHFGAKCIAIIFILVSCASFSHADEALQKSLAASLKEFTLPKLPEELKQKLRDYVPNDLKRRRDEGNVRSTAEWEKIKSREDWEAFRQKKVNLLRESLGSSFKKPAWSPPKMLAPAEVSGTIKREGYRIDKLLYRSAYGQWISANLYAPEASREKIPGFIISHAHHTPKEHGELQDMGVLWARAGCYVLVPDHLGHGERRQHPFTSKEDFNKPFQVSRQDYYFRYDVNLQLNLIGESLMGCLVNDLMTGVSLLHDLPGIDKEKIILLGAVAGGGDPCAVAAALDERITCAAPFNFGGPQPENKYPLPEDAEKTFNYGGSGGWESTRNLAYSYRDGFLPWVIVGSIAPRRLIYGHEFSWDRERDPVWKRFEKIYGFYDKADHLSFATGYGSIHVNDPPGSHCTHIGKTHRKKIHEALAKWFDIQLPGGEESTDRHDAAELRCWTDELRMKLKPVSLHVDLQAKVDQPRGTFSHAFAGYQEGFRIEWESETRSIDGVSVRQLVLSNKHRLIPLLLLEPPKSAGDKAALGVLVVTRASKDRFLRERAAFIAELLSAGLSVALPDMYGTGPMGSDTDLGRRSTATDRASTLAMFGVRASDEQTIDAYSALRWLNEQRGWDYRRAAVWSDSLVAANASASFSPLPRDHEGSLPIGPDPVPKMIGLAILQSHDKLALYLHGGVNSYTPAVEQQQMLLPQDGVPLPGSYRELLSIAPLLRRSTIHHDDTVDCLNRPVPASDTKGDSGATWIVKQLKAERK